MRCLLAVAVLASSAWAQAEAFCALRDPVRQIYSLYPGATTHRSIVRTVGPDARRIVASRLPFGLHFNELGQHTLYVAARGNWPIGMIHVRSETGRWGLIEIAWSLDLDLRVTDFRFQRCRDRSRRKLEGDAFRKQIQGKSMAELKALLDEKGTGLRRNALRVPKGAEKLATALVRSGLKTIVVTETVWKADLQILRMLDNGLSGFPNGAIVQMVQQPYPQPVLDTLAKNLKTNTSTFDRSHVRVLRILDKKRKIVGCVVRTDWKVEGASATLFWSVGVDGKIKNIAAQGEWPSKDVQEAFEGMRGHGRERFQQCACATDLAGLETVTLAQHHLR